MTADSEKLAALLRHIAKRSAILVNNINTRHQAFYLDRELGWLLDCTRRILP